MRLNLTLGQKVLAIISIPLAFELLFVGSLTYLLHQAEQEAWKQQHSRSIISECNALTKDYMDAGVMLVYYGTTKRESFLTRQKELIDVIPERFETLKILLSDSPEHKQSLENLEVVCNRGLELLTYARQSAAEGFGPGITLAAKKDFSALTEQFVTGLSEFARSQEQLQAVDPRREAYWRSLISLCLLLGVSISIAMAIGLAVAFNRSTIRRLNVVVENTSRLSQGSELAGRIGGTDEIGHLDDVFHKMADELDEVSKRKQELMSMVSHDLRSPLTAINLAMDMLASGMSGSLPPEATKQVKGASRNASKLINLINDLLDIEKLESGMLEIQPMEAPLDDLIDSTIESVKAMAEDRRVKLQTSSTNIYCFIDPPRIEQVLTNLLSNAIKFSEEGDTVTVRGEEGDGFVEIRVIDQGRGIPQTNIASLFDRFSQVRLEDGRRGKGTGLGLPICKMIVEAHGGTIGVDSEEGKGSEFYFRIPEPDASGTTEDAE